jgi:hypothetical protein
MKKVALTILFASCLIVCNAQYKNSIGLAFGAPSGVSFKTFVNRSNALDFTLGGLGYYFSLTGMYEIHAPLAEHIKWYIGPGAHIGSWNGNRYGNGLFLGADGVIGAEIKPKIPFAISADIRPSINLTGNRWNDENHWFWLQSQVSVRYTF